MTLAGANRCQLAQPSPAASSAVGLFLSLHDHLYVHQAVGSQHRPRRPERPTNSNVISLTQRCVAHGHTAGYMHPGQN